MLASYVGAIAVLSASGVHAANHAVAVGGPEFKFYPSSITAQKGDTIAFAIASPHNVQQADFSSPCSYKTNGFSSGPSYQGGSVNPELFVVTVNNTDPIYAFCSEDSHCQTGMVFVVNPPSSGNTLDAYIAKAGDTSSSTGSSAVVGGIYETSVPSGSSASGSGTSSSSNTNASASAKTNGAAAGNNAAVSGVVVGLAGVVAWLL